MHESVPFHAQRADDVAWVMPSIRPPGAVAVVTELLRQGVDPKRVLVVDDSLKGSVVAAVDVHGVLTARTRGRGQGTARNLGAARLDADWIVYVDDDIQLEDGAVRRLLDVLAGLAPESNVGIVEVAVSAVGQIGPPYWRCRVVEASRPGGFLTACMAVRRSAFLEIGGVRAKSRGGFREDTDWGIRIMQQGWRGIWADVGIRHPVEYVNFWRFLKTAAYFWHDAAFERNHPGYLAKQARRRQIGPVRVGLLRSRTPPVVAVATALSLTLTFRGRQSRPLAGLVTGLVPLVGGVTLAAAHVERLRQVAPVPASAAVDPREIAAHAVWCLVAGGSRLVGEAACLPAVLRSKIGAVGQV